MITRWLRHLVVAPVYIVIVALLVGTSPVTLAVAAAVSLIVDRRSLRPLRGWAYLLVYAVHDVAALVVGFGLWLRLGGRGAITGTAMQDRHWRLISGLLKRLVGAAESLLDLHVEIIGSEAALGLLKAREQRVIVLSRHAGPGDSFLLVNELLRLNRRPRIVLRAALQLDPCIDLLGNRLPFCWVTRRGAGTTAVRRIRALSSSMTSEDALLLFPEGGNFTEERRRRSIRTLLRKGRRRQARMAARLENVVAPRLPGVMSAIEAAPDAAIVFVVHTGLAGMQERLWRRIPVDRTLRMEMFVADAASIPQSADARAEWLFSWWKQLDEWVGDAAPAVAGQLAPDAAP